MPSVLLLVNVVVTDSRIVPSVALDKDLFVECLTKSNRQSLEHSTKSQIPVVVVCPVRGLGAEVDESCVLALHSQQSRYS
jgi:hypothetical protein